MPGMWRLRPFSERTMIVLESVSAVLEFGLGITCMVLGVWWVWWAGLLAASAVSATTAYTHWHHGTR